MAVAGAHVVVNDIKDEPAQEVIDYITKANVPGSASVYLCDVSDRAAVDAMMADTEVIQHALRSPLRPAGRPAPRAPLRGLC